MGHEHCISYRIIHQYFSLSFHPPFFSFFPLPPLSRALHLFHPISLMPSSFLFLYSFTLMPCKVLSPFCFYDCVVHFHLLFFVSLPLSLICVGVLFSFIFFFISVLTSLFFSSLVLFVFCFLYISLFFALLTIVKLSTFKQAFIAQIYYFISARRFFWFLFSSANLTLQCIPLVVFDTSSPFPFLSLFFSLPFLSLLSFLFLSSSFLYLVHSPIPPPVPPTHTSHPNNHLFSSSHSPPPPTVCCPFISLHTYIHSTSFHLPSHSPSCLPLP